MAYILINIGSCNGLCDAGTADISWPCVEAFIFIRYTKQVQVDYKDNDKKTTFKTHTQNILKHNKKI